MAAVDFSNITKSKYLLALDAMGGDNAPKSVIEGAVISAKRHKDVNFLLFGDEVLIKPLLAKHTFLKGRVKIIHTSEAISADEKPSTAIRKKNSSMKLAIEAVKEKKADAVVSAGNTGALMVISKLVLRTLDGIDRPAIGTILPTAKGSSVLLDMGANAMCSAENLEQFAIMGDAFAKASLNIENPSLGLLNIGSEDLKGNDIVRVAHQLLSEDTSFLNYKGYVEGDDIMKGTVDVIVTDGFSGNIALKSIEGTAKILTGFFKQAFKASILSKIGVLFCLPSLKKVFNKINPSNHNGAMFLGLAGISIKSHGNADGKCFSNAIKVAVNLVENKVNEKIIEELRIANEESVKLDRKENIDS
jgi:glycerol-3-phosphate acyltransferase PlsX